jgi:hypothetical protein
LRYRLRYLANPADTGQRSVVIMNDQQYVTQRVRLHILMPFLRLCVSMLIGSLLLWYAANTFIVLYASHQGYAITVHLWECTAFYCAIRLFILREIFWVTVLFALGAFFLAIVGYNH